MKGAKELADEVRDIAARQVGYVFAENARQMYEDVAAHLDRLAAIDSAVPEEVGEIRQRADAPIPLGGLTFREETQRKDLSKLLAIVQRQAGELIETRRARDAANERLEAARAEVERLEALVDEFKAASMLDVNGDPDGVTPRLLEGHVTALQTEVDRLQAERTALAQENARLINEVGELDATAREAEAAGRSAGAGDRGVSSGRIHSWPGLGERGREGGEVMSLQDEIKTLIWLAANVKYLLSELDKHAAPVVDMTKGGVLHIPVLPINEQDDADLAAILAVHDRKKKRTPL